MSDIISDDIVKDTGVLVPEVVEDTTGDTDDATEDTTGDTDDATEDTTGDTDDATDDATEDTEEDTVEVDADDLTDELAEELANMPIGAMREGETRFGIIAIEGPMGIGVDAHYMTDSSVCGDMIAALPRSVLVKGRTAEAGGVSVDIGTFIDDVIEGAGRLEGVKGIVEASGLPHWAVARLLGTFPVLKIVYDEALNEMMLAVEAAAVKAATGMSIKVNKTRTKKQLDHKGMLVGEEVSEEDSERYFPPDAGMAKFLLANRMKNRYKDDGGIQQAVQINIVGPAADL